MGVALIQCVGSTSISTLLSKWLFLARYTSGYLEDLVYIYVSVCVLIELDRIHL